MGEPDPRDPGQRVWRCLRLYEAIEESHVALPPKVALGLDLLFQTEIGQLWMLMDDAERAYLEELKG